MLPVVGAGARLPAELLAMVFEATFNLCESDCSRCKTRIAFLETCSRWRALAFETRVLWSSLYLDTLAGPRLLEIIDEHLARSGTLPLTVTIMDREYANWTGPSIRTPLVSVLARTDVFTAGCCPAMLHELRDCLSHPAHKLTEFVVVASPVLEDIQLSFFPDAPQLKTLSWRGFELAFPGALPALSTVSPPPDTSQIVDLFAHTPNIAAAVLEFRHSINNPLHIRSLRLLTLTCPSPNDARGIRTPALEVAWLKFTDPAPGLQNLDVLGTFLSRNCARVSFLKLSFAGDFNELAAVLKVCRRLHQLKLGEIGWSTSFAAEFFRDMARTDESGEWVCGRLEELTVHVVQLEGAVRTALINLAKARRVSVPEGERPLCPLRSLVVKRSKEDHDLSNRRTNFEALNKKLKEILLSEA